MNEKYNGYIEIENDERIASDDTVRLIGSAYAKELASIITYRVIENKGIGIGGSSPLKPYPSEDSSIVDDHRYEWIPRFILGHNIITLSKESIGSSFYNSVFPVGKDGLNLGRNVYYMGNDNASPITLLLNYPNVTNASNLENYATNWIRSHSALDLLNQYKYTITGPEPCVLGYGNVFVRLYRDALIHLEDTLLESTPSYPCLSMHIDVFNPQNNQYTFGPLIPDNFGETNFSDIEAPKK